MREKRRYVRSNGLVLVDYKGTKIEGKSSAFDVSGAGVRLTINRKLDIGAQVELEIYLPADSQPIRAKGKVVWLQKLKNEYFYTGIEFSVIDDISIAKISDYVCKRFR